MLLTVTCEGPHARDFGFLLHKHPASLFERTLAYGTLSVFYTENDPERATVAMLVEIDAIDLVRRGPRAAALDQYVNDRPYVASSLTSVALREAFASALAGKSKERPESVAQRLPLRARVTAVRARGGAAIVERLFRPLGYEVSFSPPELPSTGYPLGVGSLPITHHPSPIINDLSPLVRDQRRADGARSAQPPLRPAAGP